MKKLILSALFATGLVAGIEAAPTDTVTQADLQAIIQRLNKLESENKAQAAKIAELEGKNKALVARQAAAEKKSATVTVATAKADDGAIKADKTTEVSESGRIFTTESGKKYYLADATAKIFEPLSESGLQITPYGYLVFEGVYSTRPLDCDWSADIVKPKGRTSNTTLSMQDSIMGVQFDTPEAYNGWKFSGRAEFDLAGGDQNSYDFHWRHLYVNAEHTSGWSILFGQTWHLWKMVTPSEIDGAWMENTGHPYRRSPQLRVTKKWDWEDSSLEARVGIVKGGPGMGGDRDGDGVQDNTASAWALFEGALVYDRKAAWQSDDRRWLVGLGGMYGRDKSHRYNGVAFDGENDEYDSMMIMLAGSIPVWKFTLTGQIFGGQNLGGVQAGCGQTVLYHNYDNGYVKGNGVRTVGGFIDLGYELNDTWSFALGYGFDNPVDSDVEGGVNAADADHDRWPYPGVLFNDRAYVDVFYRISSNFKLGLEYARMMTRYAEEGGLGGDYGADRIQFSAFYDF